MTAKSKEGEKVANCARGTVTVERLVQWTYQNQKADVIIGGGFGLHEQERQADGIERRDVSSDGVAAMLRIGRLGVRIKGGGMGSGEIHPDAEVVHEMVMGLSPIAQGLVIDCGRSGLSIDWMPGAYPHLVRVNRGNGKPKMVYDRNEKPLWCELKVGTSFEEIAFARKTWEIWWNGLAVLWYDLTQHPDSLQSYRVTEVGVPMEPWTAGGLRNDG